MADPRRERSDTAPSDAPARALVLVAALLGWMMAGTVMVIVPLAGRAALRSLGITDEAQTGKWFSWFICAFLLGAASGGLLFGWLGDRLGRVRAMGLSILCYALLTGMTYFVTTPEQFLVLRFLACLGVGGIWPNGVALVSEVWPDVSRPMLSGLIGAAANVGFMILSGMAMIIDITPQQWRWVLLTGFAAVPLALVVLVVVPESPRWLAGRTNRAKRNSWPVVEIFSPPILKYTLIGIGLGAVPLMGNWGSANWVVPWSGRVGDLDNPALKAWAQWCKSGGGTLGALMGGWAARLMGRRTTYFVISGTSLLMSLYIFTYLQPGDPSFLYWVFGIGFFGTLYFGWLPLYLPELFPTHVRSTGAGISFNWGRVATAVGVLGTGHLMLVFNGDYARVGRFTCLIFFLGMIIILVAPDTSQKHVGARPPSAT